MHVFDLSKGRLTKRLETVSRIQFYLEPHEEVSTKVLDVSRSLEQRGAKFCFVQTVYMKRMRSFTPPQVSNVCIPARDNLK
jgi:hypothetical protein